MKKPLAKNSLEYGTGQLKVTLISKCPLSLRVGYLVRTRWPEIIIDIVLGIDLDVEGRDITTQVS